MTTFVSPHHDESLRTPARRFDYISTPAGYEVIDHDGRPLVEAFTQADASRAADTLNTAAAHGRQELVHAIEDLSGGIV
jgi:hypothetical protein